MRNKFEHNTVWDGKLRFNSALTVSAVAIFKGGEKIPDFKWSPCLRVKGNVKLHDFEKYIHDLLRAPNRGLMVVSLDWKEGSSKARLEDTKKAEETYVRNRRVGLANIISGVNLYVCPRSDTIINMLAKHHLFLRGKMSILSENKNSFIGCVVWRRYKINHLNSVGHKSSGKIPTLPVWSPIRRPYLLPPYLSTEVVTSCSNKNLKPLVEEDNENNVPPNQPYQG